MGADEHDGKTYTQPMLMTRTTATLVFRGMAKFQTMAVGIGMMIRSINMLNAQLTRTNSSLSKHLPPGITSPATTRSMAGFSYI